MALLPPLQFNQVSPAFFAGASMLRVACPRNASGEQKKKRPLRFVSGSLYLCGKIQLCMYTVEEGKKRNQGGRVAMFWCPKLGAEDKGQGGTRALHQARAAPAHIAVLLQLLLV